MAISTGALIHTVGLWLTTDQTADKGSRARPGHKPSAADARWRAMDAWEAQVAAKQRESGLELLKFQGVFRGY